MRQQLYAIAVVNALILSAPSRSVGAQAAGQSKQAPVAKPPAKPAGEVVRPVDDKGVPVPAGYVIGPDDSLTVRFWKEADLSGDVVVRSDGKISLSLLNDVQAAGYTPQELANLLEKAASKFVTDPSATVFVR
jgi:polysaccharide export outer membrane protein